MMCGECKRVADITTENRKRGLRGYATGHGMVPRHPCESPTSCTCLHNGKPVVHCREGKR